MIYSFQDMLPVIDKQGTYLYFSGFRVKLITLQFSGSSFCPLASLLLSSFLFKTYDYGRPFLSSGTSSTLCAILKQQGQPQLPR